MPFFIEQQGFIPPLDSFFSARILSIWKVFKSSSKVFEEHGLTCRDTDGGGGRGAVNQFGFSLGLMERPRPPFPRLTSRNTKTATDHYYFQEHALNEMLAGGKNIIGSIENVYLNEVRAWLSVASVD